MKQYLGTKLISARPMTRGEYNTYRDWQCPADENPADEGFLVEYHDGGKSNHPDHAGYISWSPADVFARAYRPFDGLTFGGAIEALKAGKRVTRKGWNGKGLFVFMQVPANIPADVVPRMQSLPQSVKEEVYRRANEGGSGELSYCNQLALVKPNNEINGWAPSAADALAEDWEIVG
jgi:hypothetical protein